MIRIAIIGLGHWGPNYLRILQFSETAELVAACDKDLKKHERVRRQYPQLRLVSDSSEILQDPQIDAVIIATPAATHYELVKKVLDAGKHVLVEKPLALSVKEGEDLLERALRAKRILMVGHTFLYNSAVRKMKECIDTGKLGKIYYLTAARTHLGLIKDDVSAVWDLAPHDVSIFSYLLGEEPKQVSAVGVSHLKEGLQDLAFASLLYDHNIIGNIHISWVDSNKQREVAVIGSKARVVFDDLNLLERIRIFEKGVSLDRPYETFGEFQLLLRDGDIISPKVEPEEPLRKVCLEFIHSVETGERPLADGQNGLAVVRTMCAIEKSIRQWGAPVPIERG